MSETQIDILKVIEARFDGLSPQLRVAARFALDSPDRMAVHSMREVASQVNVLPATMGRLAIRLGFNSYTEFRNRFRDRILPETGTYAARARRLQMRNSATVSSVFLKEMAETDTDNIERSFSQSEEGAFQAAAGSLIEAEKIYVVGLRKCFPVAYFFHYATRLFFPTAQLLEGKAGLFGEEISAIGSKDVLLAVAFDPYTKETVQAVNAAHHVGAKVISLTDSNVSPLAERATHLFLAANRSPSFYRSLVGAMALAQALVAAVVNELGPVAVQKLEVSELNLRKSYTYWNKGKQDQ
ncbi:MurR/RpiR family transcriptional regulator [Sneathiella marina]|uniref:MurR/RpiR family transcriptional regulator n=1 Tax=Sneathiella marina TaxID=2950108 RepID=A0ABY4W413_9PROT|nr:MurR/RpiR family transcriptional regulator [Sneathiella marina]USG60632.1 MurR/RpiR family transcriptional regulator [Sneathiella marina]